MEITRTVELHFAEAHCLVINSDSKMYRWLHQDSLISYDEARQRWRADFKITQTEPLKHNPSEFDGTVLILFSVGTRRIKVGYSTFKLLCAYGCIGRDPDFGFVGILECKREVPVEH